jgi:uncharacterized protein involved in outer membrane biogenesis
MIKIQKRLRILFETVILVFMVGLVAFIITVSSIDLENYRAQIIDTLDTSLGGEVRLGKIEFSLFPYFGVRGRDFSLAGDENTPAIRADEVVIGLKIFPLISGKIVPKKLRVIYPTVSLTIEKDELLLDKIVRIINRAAPAEGGEITLRELVIHDGSLIITDKRFGRTRDYTIGLSYGWFKGDLKNGPLKYSLLLTPPGGQGTIKSKGETRPDGGLAARISLDRVSLDSANLVFTDYGSILISGTVSGSFTLTYYDAHNLNAEGRIVGANLRLKGSPAYPKGLAIDEVDISGALALTPSGVAIHDLAISHGSLDVRADVALMKVLHRNGYLPNLTVSADIKGFDLGSDIALLPLGLLKKGAGEYAAKLARAGRIDARVDIDGDPSLLGTRAARLETTCRLTGGVFDLGGIVVSGVRADLAVSADEITVKNVAFSDPPGKVKRLQWRVEHAYRAPYLRDLTVVVDDMAFEDVKDILASEVVAALPFLRPTKGTGRVRGVMKVEAPMAGTRGVPEVTGWVKFSDWALTVPFFTKTPLPGEATLIFEKNKMTIPPVTMRFAESTLTGEGELVSFARPRLVMSITAPTIDLTELFGTGDASLRLTDFTSRLIFEEGYIILPDLKGKLYGGTCSGEFGYVYPVTEQESLFYLNLAGEATDIGALLADTGISHNVTGRAGFTLSLKSEPGDPQTILKTMDGTVAIAATEGTIRRLSLLSKVMSAMQISNYLRLKFPKLDTEGIPFDSITGDFAIEDGTLKTENLYFNSRVMKITTVGSYDTVHDNLDMVMGYQLLQTIDLIVNKIPVVGYILTGDDGNLFTTYFKVTGSIKDPTVEPMTLEALGKGTLNIFSRILHFPLKGFIPR